MVVSEGLGISEEKNAPNKRFISFYGTTKNNVFFFPPFFAGYVVFWHVSLMGVFVDGDITLVRLQMPPFVSPVSS